MTNMAYVAALVVRHIGRSLVVGLVHACLYLAMTIGLGAWLL